MFRVYITGVPGRFDLGPCGANQRQYEAVRVFEWQHGLAKTLFQCVMRDAHFNEAMCPVAYRTRGDTERRFLRKPHSSATGRGVFPRKEREDSAGMTFGVAVVKVICTGVVEVHGFLDEAQPYMRIEIEVACRLARYRCDVMNSSHGGDPLHSGNRVSLKMAVA